MKVFISWSGDLSHNVAELLCTWIGDVLQGVKTWISSKDIEKGSLWFSEISDQFEDTGIGIICISKENMNSPWILFEAGALSKGLTQNRVCPLLIDLGFTDLIPPLSQFNGTLPNKEDMFKLVNVINSQNHVNALSTDSIKKTFDKWWPDFEQEFSRIVKDHKTVEIVPIRSMEDMIDEILQISRSLQNILQKEPIIYWLSELQKEENQIDKKKINAVVNPSFYSPNINRILAAASTMSTTWKAIETVNSMTKWASIMSKHFSMGKIQTEEE